MNNEFNSTLLFSPIIIALLLYYAFIFYIIPIWDKYCINT